MKRLCFGIACLSGLLASSVTVEASVPDPFLSDTPDCIVICPGSDICQTVIIRDQNNDRMENVEVRMIFSAVCEDQICWCAGQSHPVIGQVTNANGEAVFCIDAGGCCEDVPYAVVFEVDPGAIIFNAYDCVASPDNHSNAGGAEWGEGDCDVDLNDFVRFSGIFLTNDCCGNLFDEVEFDGVCDHDINLSDFVAFSQHFLHSCTPR